MPYLIIILVLLAAVMGPSLWVGRIMRRYSEPADRYPNSGGEVARRLLDLEIPAHVLSVGIPYRDRLVFPLLERSCDLYCVSSRQ